MIIQIHMMTRLYLGAPFRIRQMKLNDDDQHLGFASQPLIKDETSYPMATPKFCLFIPMFFEEICILGCFE